MLFWIKQGIQSFILSVGYKHEKIIEYFGNEFRGIKIDYSIESAPLGTGGGLISSINQFKPDEDILVLNGDTFFEIDLKELEVFHYKKKSDITFSLFKSSDSDRYMCIKKDKSGRVVSMSEPIITHGFVNGGVYIMNPKLFSKLDYKIGDNISLESEIFKEIFKSKARIYGKNFPSFFVDIGIPDDFFNASKYLL